MSELECTADNDREVEKSTGNEEKYVENQGIKSESKVASIRCTHALGCSCLITVLLTINIAVSSVFIYRLERLTYELSKYNVTLDQRVEILETQSKKSSLSLEEVNISIQEFQSQYAKNITSLMQLYQQISEGIDSSSAGLNQTHILQWFDFTMSKLQNFEWNIEVVYNMSASQFNELNGDLLDVQQAVQANISSLKNDITEQVRNLSDHVDHLSLSHDDHANQLSQISANISHIILNHLAQVNNDLDALDSTQQSMSEEIQSLQAMLSSLRLRLSHTEGLLLSQREELENQMSQLNETLQNIQAENSAASNERNALQDEIENVRQLSSSVTFHHSNVLAFVCISLSTLIFY